MTRSLGNFFGSALAFAACASSGFAALSQSNLVGYYTFDNGGVDSVTWATGGVVDAVLRAQDGVANYSSAQSMFGSSLYVSGGGFATIANSPKYRFGTGSFTLTYWAYLPSSVSSDPTLIGNKDWSGSRDNQGWAQAMVSNDDVRANVGIGVKDAGVRTDPIDMDPYGQTAGANPSSRGWTFMALVVDRENGLLWNYVADHCVPATDLDFGADSSSPTSVDISAFTTYDFDAPLGCNINIGQDGDGTGYTQLTAYFDDVALWNTALSRAELWEIYSRGRGGESLGDILMIPEPSTYAFAATCGAIAFLAVLRRRKKARVV